MRGNLHSAIQYVATALALVAIAGIVEAEGIKKIGNDAENEPRLSGAHALKGGESIYRLTLCWRPLHPASTAISVFLSF
jgi:hypothetical protein